MNFMVANMEHVIETLNFNGDIRVDIVGYYRDNPNIFESYDLFVDEECINLGNSFYEYPTNKEIQLFLDNFMAL